MNDTRNGLPFDMRTGIVLLGLTGAAVKQRLKDDPLGQGLSQFSGKYVVDRWEGTSHRCFYEWATTLPYV